MLSSFMPFSYRPLLVMLAIGASACAGVGAVTPTASSMRLLVKTSAAADAAAVTYQVSVATQLPLAGIAYVGASGGDWHAVLVDCASEARCDDALARLKADTAHFAAVEPDGKKTSVPRSKAQ